MIRLIALIVAGVVAQAAFAAPRPNVVIVLLDDVGYGDFACTGNPIIKSPNIDRLHGESIRLTDFHVAPMCTPTRAQLLSGHDALDNKAMNVSSGRAMLRADLPTLADVFRAAGYRTGLFGKWHVGDAYPYRPQDRGFERAIWFPSSHIPSAPDYFNNDYFDPHLRTEDGTVKQFKGYCSDVFVGEAISWIRDRAAAREPFFAYIPLNVAHGPLWVPDKYREPYRSLPKPLASFYAMIANADENLGKLESALRDLRLADNTILIFFTDNGGTAGVKTFNAGMKGGKVTLWEGGHRVPCFIRYPAGDLGAPRDVAELTQVQDIFPTLIDLCALTPPAKGDFDGMSLAPILRGGANVQPDRMLVVQFTRLNDPVPKKFESAVLWKKWRLLHGRELYDVSDDLAQDHDVAAEHADVVAKMRQHYEQWWAELEPTVNDLCDITIGTDAEPVTLLSPADWQDVFLDQQQQIREAAPRNGPWGVNVAREGEYTFELRRWPRETNAALTAAMPPQHAVDGEMPAGKALPIAKAKLRVGGDERSQQTEAGDQFVRFTLPLKPGRTKVQTWFYDAAGNELCGAYYVYVRRNN